MNNDFMSVLFDPGEATCFGTNAKGTRVFSISSVDLSVISKHCPFFSINPLNVVADLKPEADYHASDKPRRADHNVTSYRSFLLEMDSTSLEEQLAHVKSIGLPWSTCTFSGNKSYHFIISLEQPLSERSEYDSFAKRLLKAMGGLADPSTKNPSRFSRFPGHLRTDTGKEQSLKGVNGRISRLSLETWLLSRGVNPIAVSQTVAAEPVYPNMPLPISAVQSELNGFTKNALMIGFSQNEGRNNQLFKAAIDFANNQIPVEVCMDKLIPVAEASGLSSREIISTINSAYRKKN